jgi:serine/threonine protein kinase
MKPENVFIESRGGDDHVKVLDFGIAKVMSDDRQAPGADRGRADAGTLEFMSPEQLRGQKLDGRSDIYALGMMAYEMLTGKLPFQSAKTPIDIINFHMKTEAPPPSRSTETSPSRRRRRDHREDGAEGPRAPLRERDALREEIARASARWTARPTSSRSTGCSASSDGVIVRAGLSTAERASAHLPRQTRAFRAGRLGGAVRFASLGRTGLESSRSSADFYGAGQSPAPGPPASANGRLDDLCGVRVLTRDGRTRRPRPIDDRGRHEDALLTELRAEDSKPSPGRRRERACGPRSASVRRR